MRRRLLLCLYFLVVHVFARHDIHNHWQKQKSFEKYLYAQMPEFKAVLRFTGHRFISAKSGEIKTEKFISKIIISKNTTCIITRQAV